MVAVIPEYCTIPLPNNSGGRTTSRGAGEGEHRRVSGWICDQLEGDILWDTDLACMLKTKQKKSSNKTNVVQRALILKDFLAPPIHTSSQSDLHVCVH